MKMQALVHFCVLLLLTADERRESEFSVRRSKCNAIMSRHRFG